MPLTTTKGWDPRIEGLRGFSILLVVVHHLSDHGMHNWGSLGVSIFFIISGYVITGSISRQFKLHPVERLNIWTFLQHFYIRRARRLLPLAILVILTTFTISLLDPNADRRQYILSSIFCLFYIGNLFGFAFSWSDLAPGLAHFWSLAVEEQFYFIWPILFYLVCKSVKIIKHFPFWLFFGIILIQLSHPIIAFAGVTVWTLPTTYFDLLLLGCALNFINEKVERVYGRKLIFIKLTGFLALISILFGTRFSSEDTISNFQNNLNFLLVGTLFIFTLNSNFFNNFCLKFFGKISYSLYCIHWPLTVFCKSFFGDSSLLMICVALISIVLSVLSHRYFESRFYKSIFYA